MAMSEESVKDAIPVVQVGLGQIGSRVTRYLLENGAFRLVGAVDVDPDKVGRDVGSLADLDDIGVQVVARLTELDLPSGGVVVISTASSLTKVAPQVLEAVEAGQSVVSTCEELCYPWRTHPQLARQIDRQAREKGVGVLGTGINPGFMMDFLALTASAVCLEVRRVTVERVQDAAPRRQPFQEKIGVGLAPEAFKEKVSLGDLRHVGLTESMHMIADRLGWRLGLTEDRIESVPAEHDLECSGKTIKEGQALGVEQTGHGFIGQREVILLRFRATLGEPETFDRVHLDGVPPIELRIPGGVNGDVGTGAITVNAIPSLLRSAPGLRNMSDVLPVSCFNASRREYDGQD